MADQVGQQLGNYHLIRLLGQGGFADVYLGEHIYLKTYAAIKVLRTRLINHDLKGFLTEARTIANFTHPHIIRILDFGVDKDTPFLAMEYAPHGTLRQRHPKGTLLPLTTIISYVKQVADGLQYLHNKRLVHRDIKPENMLLGQRNEVLLSDFGIALVTQSSLYQNGDVAGTISYMAPEQIQARPRPASDQYALGIVVYEWVCGARPFQGSWAEIAAKHISVPPSPLRERIPTISPMLEEVVLTVLQKDPHKRFPSVQAFATALEQSCQPNPQELLKQTIPHTSTLPSLSQLPPVAPSPQSPTMVAPQSHRLEPAIIPISSVRSWFPRERLSRRTVVVGLAGLTTIGIGISWLTALQKHSTGVPSRNPTVTSVPLGTTFYIHHSGNEVASLSWSPDGKLIVSGSLNYSPTNVNVVYDSPVQSWEALTGKNIVTYNSGQVTFGAQSVAWSPNGQYIASGDAPDNDSVRVWNAVTRNYILTYRHDTGLNYGAVFAVAWSPSGTLIASGGEDKKAQVWDVTTKSKISIYPRHSDYVYTVAWSPDNKFIASGSKDKTAQVWNALNGEYAFTYSGHSGEVNSVAWSPSGKLMASGSSDKTIQVWDATNGKYIFTYRHHNGSVSTVAWSYDSKRIASGSKDGTVQIWDATTGDHIYTFHGHSAAINTIAWSPNHKLIASGDKDGTIRIWQAM